VGSDQKEIKVIQNPQYFYEYKKPMEKLAAGQK
jgi:hypothetical protein